VVSASSNPSPEAKSAAFKVESPRASDAIGKALRDIYVREMGLPEDMATMLHQLNGHPSRKHC